MRHKRTYLKYKILQLLDKRVSIHREHVAKELHEPRTTVFDALAELEIQGLIRRVYLRNGRRGRPKVFWVKTN